MIIKELVRSKLDKYSIESLIGQFLRYLVTGGVAFVLDYGLFAICLYYFGLHYLWANFAGLVLGLIVNYSMSILWVFSACKRTMEKQKVVEFLMFALVGFIGIGLNQLMMYFLVETFSINEMISKIVGTIVVLMWNFGARKVLLFRNKTEE